MDDLLKIELRLLLLRYGRRKIVGALAALGDQKPEELDAELALLEQRKVDRKPKKLPAAADLVAQVCRERPESAQILQTLATRYENRTFLPHLRDVERFLDQTGFPHGRLKSRREAARQVVTALCQLNIEELKRLAAPPQGQGDSDFALLAREIMGRGRTQGGPSEGDR
jgi:hypothetical protein